MEEDVSADSNEIQDLLSGSLPTWPRLVDWGQFEVALSAAPCVSAHSPTGPAPR